METQTVRKIRGNINIARLTDDAGGEEPLLPLEP
jgi:hypothetical protein